MHRLIVPLIALACAACPSFEKPTLSVDGAKVAVADFNGATVNVDVTIENPNPIPLFADRLAFQGFVEDKPLTKGELNKRVTVPAKGKANVSVPLRFVYKELGQAAAAMKDKDRWDYEVKGEVGFAPHEKLVIVLPFKKGGDLPAPRLPKVRTANARLEDPSLQRVTVAVDVTIENGNAFSLPAGALEGTVDLGGRKTPIRVTVPPTPAEKSQTLTVRQPIALAGLAAVAADVVGGKAVTATLDGAVRFGERAQPVKASLTLKR